MSDTLSGVRHLVWPCLSGPHVQRPAFAGALALVWAMQGRREKRQKGGLAVA
ncbi:unnamed protein product [Bordetella petrii]|uniref:Uncharacterized protein n=1 Tax=Bordetella petrii (strain ATCC BAA-461 / DSM 12804 / CCUG 43448 / CIP 107267 / Se-1111R) TaxID=340100 RepID=A9IJY3_BORPD|nr:unnamed protein product [Bordetella petrii]